MDDFEIKTLAEEMAEWNAKPAGERIQAVMECADMYDEWVDKLTDRFLDEMPSYTSEEASHIDNLIRTHREIAEMMLDAVTGKRRLGKSPEKAAPIDYLCDCCHFYGGYFEPDGCHCCNAPENGRLLAAKKEIRVGQSAYDVCPHWSNQEDWEG